MKISQKLILAFSILIMILLSEIILNQIITNRATETYDTLQLKINPAISILSKYESINKELNLLINNRINGGNEISTINRIKGIIEVELVYIKNELVLLKENVSTKDFDITLIEKIITDTDELILSSNKINDLLNSTKDYKSNLMIANDILNTKIVELYLSLERNIKQLNLNYTRAFEAYNSELTKNLNSISKIILITGIIGILLGLIITVQVTYTISEPIYKLKKAALRISKGRLDEKIIIKGQSELKELGDLFNNMSSALTKSFKEQEKQIEQIKLMNKELEQFVYVASHDLQEPLRTMSSYISLIAELHKDKLDDEALRFMKYVEDASIRMKTLIKDLLDYSRLGKEIKTKKVDCNKLVQNILLDFELIIKENNASIHIEKLPVVKGYEVELKQLFQNLISNGLKFRKKDVPPQIEIKVIDKPEYWLFSVADNGIGMNKKHFERVFVIFQRLHNKDDYKGTGIGLAVCKKVVEMHHGKIWIDSELNEGTTFYFTIFKKTKNL